MWFPSTLPSTTTLLVSHTLGYAPIQMQLATATTGELETSPSEQPTVKLLHANNVTAQLQLTVGVVGVLRWWQKAECVNVTTPTDTICIPAAVCSIVQPPQLCTIWMIWHAAVSSTVAAPSQISMVCLLLVDVSPAAQPIAQPNTLLPTSPCCVSPVAPQSVSTTFKEQRTAVTVSVPITMLRHLLVGAYPNAPQVATDYYKITWPTPSVLPPAQQDTLLMGIIPVWLPVLLATSSAVQPVFRTVREVHSETLLVVFAQISALHHISVMLDPQDFALKVTYS